MMDFAFIDAKTHSTHTPSERERDNNNDNNLYIILRMINLCKEKEND